MDADTTCLASNLARLARHEMSEETLTKFYGHGSFICGARFVLLLTLRETWNAVNTHISSVPGVI